MIMKKIFAMALISLAFFSACKKAFEQPADYSSVAVIQASPVVVQTQTTPTDTLHVFVDTMRYNATGMTYNTNSGYLPVLSGSKTINIRRGINSTYTNYVNSFTYNFEVGKAQTFVVYDTATSSTGQAKLLRLKDDLTLPAANMSHVRFLHLAPNGPAVDVTLVRTSVAPTGTPVLSPFDSVTITNKSYVGATPNEDALSAFTPVPRGTLYTVKVKTAGTQTVLTSFTLNLTQSQTTGSDVNQGRIVTLYVTGTAKGRSLAPGFFRHY
jgi:uncharacterized membrane protein